MTTTLETALHLMDADVQLTPRSLLQALHQTEAMSVLGYPPRENDTVMYRRPIDPRYPGPWLKMLADHQRDYLNCNSTPDAEEHAIASLRYALDKAGLTLVER